MSEDVDGPGVPPARDEDGTREPSRCVNGEFLLCDVEGAGMMSGADAAVSQVRSGSPSEVALLRKGSLSFLRLYLVRFMAAGV